MEGEELLETSTPLWAAAKVIGRACDAQNMDFIRCKADNKDPAACVQQGRAVTQCAVNVEDSLNKRSRAWKMAQVSKYVDTSKHFVELEDANFEENFHKCVGMRLFAEDLSQNKA